MAKKKKLGESEALLRLILSYIDACLLDNNFC